jgi:uncharacterized protein (DUF2141 family)
MKKLILIIALVTTAVGTSSAQDSNKIIVTVNQIESSEGTIKIAVFNSKEEFLGKAFLSKSIDASPGQLRFEFDEVPNGEYTISIYHDENGNNELDTNFIGIPNEPYGISLEGKSMFGPPNYNDAKFTLLNESTSLIISLD